LRPSIVVLIAVITVGSVTIVLGFLTNQEYVEISKISNQYEKLENYQIKLEKINQSNQKILDDLEKQIKNSNDSSFDQIREEIDIVKRVIDENKAELENVIEGLSQIKSSP